MKRFPISVFYIQIFIKGQSTNFSNSGFCLKMRSMSCFLEDGFSTNLLYLFISLSWQSSKISFGLLRFISQSSDFSCDLDYLYRFFWRILVGFADYNQVEGYVCSFIFCRGRVQNNFALILIIFVYIIAIILHPPDSLIFKLLN